MAIFEAKMTSKGQVTVPAEVRELFGIKPGDKLLFCTGENRGLKIIVKNRRAVEMAGMLASDALSAPLSIEELGDALGEALGEDDRRIRDDWNRHQRTSSAAGKRRPAAE